MSGSSQPTLLVRRSFDPSLPGFIIAAIWSALETSAYQQIWVHCQLQIVAGAGMGLQERFRSLTSLTRTADRLPWLINQQLVTLRWLTLTKSKWPRRVLVFIGTVCGKVQPMKHFATLPDQQDPWNVSLQHGSYIFHPCPFHCHLYFLQC